MFLIQISKIFYVISEAQDGTLKITIKKEKAFIFLKISCPGLAKLIFEKCLRKEFGSLSLSLRQKSESL
jgi:hypothetical protein